MADKKITDLQLISALADAVNFPVDDTIQTFRATSLQMADYVKTKLNVLRAFTSDTAIAATDKWITVDPTAGSFTLNLTSCASLPTGFMVGIKNIATNGNVVTLDASSTQLIDGALTRILRSTPTQESVILVNTGAAWLVYNTTPAYGSCYLDTFAGRGSTNTRIAYFTNSAVVGGDLTLTTNDSTSGAAVTVNNPGRYYCTFHGNINADNYFGVSKNSNQLTTSILSITLAHYLISTHAGSDQLSECSYIGDFAAGDVLRPHFEAASTTGSFASRCYFRVVRIG